MTTSIVLGSLGGARRHFRFHLSQNSYAEQVRQSNIEAAFKGKREMHRPRSGSPRLPSNDRLTGRLERTSVREMLCPGDIVLADYVARPDTDSARQLDEHLAECQSCRGQVFAFSAAQEVQPPDAVELATGSAPCAADGVPAVSMQIGRFLLQEEIGAGSMGTVYQARDTVLERQVAIKILRSNSALDADQRIRLLREAQSLAQLTHPHVVTIYEAGEQVGHVYIAMERIDGPSLDIWLETPRTWREIVQVFAQAALGLHAAHLANLIHRDVKPRNILIADNNRAVVVDFGLVGDEKRIRTAGEREANADPVLTQTGALIGTPAYASPEQLCGQQAQVQSDVFSLCVALFEALCGIRPFAGKNIAQLRQSIKEGTLQHTRPPAVPRALWGLVREGLNADPNNRPSSMQVIADKLARVCAAPIRRRRLAIASVALAGLAGLSAAFAFAPTKRIAPCQGASAQFANVWHSKLGASLAERFANVAPAIADARTSNVTALIDGYREQWVGTHHEVCMASEHGEQSSELLDQRMRCLERDLFQLKQSLEVLSSADREMVVRSLDVLSGLPDPGACGRKARVAVPAIGDAERVSSLETRLDEAEVLLRAGEGEEALDIVAEVSVAANEVGYGPLTARALLTRGEVEESLALFSAAADSYRAATIAATSAALPTEQARAFASLAHLFGGELADATLARDPLALAMAMVDSDQIAEPLVRAEILQNLSDVYFNDHKGTLGFKLLRESMRALDEAGPGTRVQELRGTGLIRRADIELAQGDYQVALRSYGEALPLLMGLKGKDHDALAHLHENVGQAQQRLALYDEAGESYNRAAEIRETLAGAGNVFSAVFFRASAAEGELAATLYKEALKLAIQTYGPLHPHVAVTADSAGLALASIGRHEEAMQYFAQNVRIAEQTRAPDSRELASAHSHQLESLVAVDQSETAREQGERASKILCEQEEGDVECLYARMGHASALLALERWQEAHVVLLASREATVLVSALVGQEVIQVLDLTIAYAAVNISPSEEALAKLQLLRDIVGQTPDADAEFMREIDDLLATNRKR